MKTFVGTVASEGFANGAVRIVTTEKRLPTLRASQSVDVEKKILATALAAATTDLDHMQVNSKSGVKESTEIIEAHIMMLQDPEVLALSQAEIDTGQNAESAYASVIENFRQMFLDVPDPIIQQRAIDLYDISQRVLFYMQFPNEKYPDLTLDKPTILVAKDFTPSQIFTIDKKYLLGIATVEGAPTSHTSILARSLEIPFLVGLDAAVLTEPTSTLALLNGGTGHSPLNPPIQRQPNFCNIRAIFNWQKKMPKSSKASRPVQLMVCKLL